MSLLRLSRWSTPGFRNWPCARDSEAVAGLGAVGMEVVVEAGMEVAVAADVEEAVEGDGNLHLILQTSCTKNKTDFNIIKHTMADLYPISVIFYLVTFQI